MTKQTSISVGATTIMTAGMTRTLSCLLVLLLASLATAQDSVNAIIGDKPGVYHLKVTVRADKSLEVEELKPFRLGSTTTPDPRDDDNDNGSTAEEKLRAAVTSATASSKDSLKFREEISLAYHGIAEGLRSGDIKTTPISDFQRLEERLLDRQTRGEVGNWYAVRDAVIDYVNSTKPDSPEKLADAYEAAGAIVTEGMTLDVEKFRIDIERIMELIKFIIETLRLFGVGAEGLEAQSAVDLDALMKAQYVIRRVKEEFGGYST